MTDVLFRCGLQRGRDGQEPSVRQERAWSSDAARGHARGNARERARTRKVDCKEVTRKARELYTLDIQQCFFLASDTNCVWQQAGPCLFLPSFTFHRTPPPRALCYLTDALELSGYLGRCCFIEHLLRDGAISQPARVEQLDLTKRAGRRKFPEAFVTRRCRCNAPRRLAA